MYVGNLTEKILVNFNFSIASIDYLILADLAITREGWTRSHALFIIWWFPYVSIYVSRQLNVIDSGKIVLVITTFIKI